MGNNINGCRVKRYDFTLIVVKSTFNTATFYLYLPLQLIKKKNMPILTSILVIRQTKRDLQK
jgi:hypothetical protein